MARSEQQPNRAHIPQGRRLRVSLEGSDAILEISNLPGSRYTVEHRPANSRETHREKLWAKFPEVFFPHVRARLDQHGYKAVGGEEISGEMTLMETEKALKEWLEQAKGVGVSNQEAINGATELLKFVVIGATKMGEISPLVKGISTEIGGLVDEVWGKREIKR